MRLRVDHERIAAHRAHRQRWRDREQDPSREEEQLPLPVNGFVRGTVSRTLAIGPARISLLNSAEKQSNLRCARTRRRTAATPLRLRAHRYWKN